MRTFSYWAGGLAITALAGLADTRPSHAYVWYPWCVNYNGRPGTPVCGFTSFDQCMATASGNQGTCTTNPWMPSSEYDRIARKSQTKAQR
jgi:hypothetical protein